MNPRTRIVNIYPHDGRAGRTAFVTAKALDRALELISELLDE